LSAVGIYTEGFIQCAVLHKSADLNDCAAVNKYLSSEKCIL